MFKKKKLLKFKGHSIQKSSNLEKTVLAEKEILFLNEHIAKEWQLPAPF